MSSCDNCKAKVVNFNGLETTAYCGIGVSEEDAYDSETDLWGCKYNDNAIDKKLKEQNNGKINM